MDKLLLACLLLLGTFLAPSPSAAAECTEFSTPAAIISAAGHFCLGGNLTVTTTSGYAVKIDANNVELDCRGYSIINNSTDPAGNANAIFVQNHRNVRVRNCNISGGWAAGIWIYQDNGLANQNRNIEVSGNSVTGATWYGILAYGTGITVRDNRISDIGGRGSFAMGIRVGASGLAGEPRYFVVEHNVIDGIESPVNNAYAIYGNNPLGSLFVDNAIYDTGSLSDSYWGYGVYLAASSERNRISGNTIDGGTLSNDVGVNALSGNACYHNQVRGVSPGADYVNCTTTNGNY